MFDISNIINRVVDQAAWNNQMLKYENHAAQKKMGELISFKPGNDGLPINGIPLFPGNALLRKYFPEKRIYN